MIVAALTSMLPTTILLIVILIVLITVTEIQVTYLLRALLIGMLVVIPAIYTMRILGVVMKLLIPVEIPLLLFTLLSVINEEFIKYLTIRLTAKKEQLYSYAIFIGGGFSLLETVTYSLGDPHVAILRTYTALPLHIVTSLLLAYSIKQEKKLILLAPLIIHIGYNVVM